MLLNHFQLYFIENRIIQKLLWIIVTRLRLQWIKEKQLKEVLYLVKQHQHLQVLKFKF